jgi:tRNA modification GTPase
MVTIEDGHAPTPFLLVDTAGIGAATTDVLESHATAAATRAIDSGDVVVRCRPADDADDGGSFPSTVFAAVIDVITKCDLGPGLDPRTAPGTDDAPIRVSSVTGAGIEGLQRRISKAVADVTGSDIRRSLLDRLSRGLRAAESRLDEALVLLASAEADVAIPSPELVAASIRAAVDELGLLDGSLDPERVLDDVFGRFCIGK